MMEAAGTQHFDCGGFCAAPASSLVSERGRWLIQIWSCASMVMPPTCPMIQLLGSALGQKGSTLKVGPSAAAGEARLSTAKTARVNPVLRVKIGMRILPDGCRAPDRRGLNFRIITVRGV